MTRRQRENFTPTDPTEFVVDTIASGFESATSALSQLPGEAVDFVTQIPDFTVDAVENTIDEMRDVYDASAQTYNLITNVIETPCEDKWNVIIETALPAAGSSLWMLLTPNPGEMLEEYLSPKGSRKGGRGGKDTKNKYRQKGKSGKIRRRWPALPHVDSLVADRLPGAQAIQGRDIGLGQRFLFTGIDVADRALWYFLVMDVAENFFTKWSSGIMESRFCSRPFNFLIAAEHNGGEVDNLTNDINDYQRYAINSAKGRVPAAFRIITFNQPLDGEVDFSFTLACPEPITHITADNFQVFFYRNGEFHSFQQFELGVQEGDTTIEVSGSANFINTDQVWFVAGNIAVIPAVNAIISGSVLAFGEPHQ